MVWDTCCKVELPGTLIAISMRHKLSNQELVNIRLSALRNNACTYIYIIIYIYIYVYCAICGWGSMKWINLKSGLMVSGFSVIVHIAGYNGGPHG